MKLTRDGFLILILLIRSTTADACTLAEVQNSFSQLNQVFLSYNRAIIAQRTPSSETAMQADTPTIKLAVLLEKRADIKSKTAVIRKLFAAEVLNKPRMKTQDAITPLICEKFVAASKLHNIVLNMAPIIEERPSCTKDDLNPRFIAAIRLQRKLTLAGKINGKERVNYLKMVRQFKENSENNFALACRTLHDYEKMLQAERSDE